MFLKSERRNLLRLISNCTYYIADSLVMNGNERSLHDINPLNTKWERNRDTGDILSLVDHDYIVMAVSH